MTVVVHVQLLGGCVDDGGLLLGVAMALSSKCKPTIGNAPVALRWEIAWGNSGPDGQQPVFMELKASLPLFFAVAWVIRYDVKRKWRRSMVLVSLFFVLLVGYMFIQR